MTVRAYSVDCCLFLRNKVFLTTISQRSGVPESASSYYNKSLDEIEQLSKKVVWFTIDNEYGKYRIIMFYDNYNNRSDGDDL